MGILLGLKNAGTVSPLKHSPQNLEQCVFNLPMHSLISKQRRWPTMIEGICGQVYWWLYSCREVMTTACRINCYVGPGLRRTWVKFVNVNKFRANTSRIMAFNKFHTWTNIVVINIDTTYNQILELAVIIRQTRTESSSQFKTQMPTSSSMEQFHRTRNTYWNSQSKQGI